MNGKKAKALRKAVGFQPRAERRFTRHKNGRGIPIHGTQVVVGSRRLYRGLKRAYNAGDKDRVNAVVRELDRRQGKKGRRRHERK